jgi:prepilin-type N-terminal cleavage/methylation domain-containing protein
MRKVLAHGFTLVELLIVIALLGVIATIVIAAINPIEQANRATDSGNKADASNLVSALQRYYTGHNNYPWNVGDPATYDSADDAFGFIDAQDSLVGLCDATGCTTAGELIDANELQIAFLSRKFITTTSDAQKLFVGKGQGSSSGVFVCWVPKSNSNRQTAITNGKVVDIDAGLDATTSLPSYTQACDAGPTVAGWDVTDGILPGCGECVPE